MHRAITATLLSLVLPRSHRIIKNAHSRWARKEYGAKCFITGSRRDLESHHAWSYRWFPPLRFAPINKVYLNEKVHKDYHVNYLGGYHVPATWLSLIAYKYSVQRMGLAWLSGKLMNASVVVLLLVAILKH